jgi:NIMA (never in mitosis gene a)-related kinase 1/4/5
MEELGPDNKKAAVRESRLLQVLNHDNIIRFKEVYKTNRGKLCIVMDYADAGNIYDRIRMQREIKDQDGNQIYFDKD